MKLGIVRFAEVNLTMPAGANITVNTKGAGGVIKGSVEFTYKPVDSTLPHTKCVTTNNITSCYAE